MHPVVVLEESRALYWDRNSEMTELGEKLPNSPFGFCRDVEVFEGCNDGLEFAEARSGEGSRWLDGRERMSIKSSSSEISMGTAEKCDVALARIRVGAKVGPVLLHRYRSQA
ncbi:hypothetical protein JHK85_028393 [Glycine max]|nr:hypothetical protein JHK85_028393 [Glycine max]